MKKKPYRYVLYILARCLIHVLGHLPLSIVRCIARALGAVVYASLRRERQKVMRHLTVAYGETLALREKKRIARNVFTNLSIVCGDLMYLRYRSVARAMALISSSAEDRGRYQEAVQQGKGFIVAASHLGNWELMAAFLVNAFPYTAPVAVIGKRIYYERYNDLIIGLRERFGVRTIYRDASFKAIVRILKQGGGIGILTDQDVDSIPGIFVDFFGKPAYTTDSIARLAALTGAPVIPCALVREGKRYRFLVDDIIYFDQNADRDEAIRAVTQRVSSCIEKYIRAYPDQWVWMHNRWKTQAGETPHRNQ